MTSSTKQGTAVIKATSDSVLTPDVTKVKFMKVVSDKKGHDVEVSGLSTNFEEMITTLNDVVDEYFMV